MSQELNNVRNLEQFLNLQYRPPSRPNSRLTNHLSQPRLSLVPSQSNRPLSAAGQRALAIVNAPIKEKPNYLKFINHLGPGLRNIYLKEDKKISIKDTRPLKDPKFQQESIRNILNYLHHCSTLTEVKRADFKSPKPEVVLPIFKALYEKFFPRHEFGAKLAHELGELLVRLGYPYQGTFPKNINPVGSYQNWPHFLGLLDWMTRRLKVLESYQLENLYLEHENFAEVECNKFYDSRYLAEYSQLAVDHTKADQLKEDFKTKHEFRLKAWEEEILELQEKKQSLDKDYEAMKAFENAYYEIKNGLDHDKNEIKIMEELYPKLHETLEKKDEKIKLATAKIQEEEARILSLEDKKRALEQKVAEQPVSYEEVTIMKEEQVSLINSMSEMNEKIASNIQLRRELEKDLAKITTELEDARDEFNTACQKLGLNDTNLHPNTNFNLQLELRADSPQNIATIDLWGVVKDVIQNQKNIITEAKHSLQSEIIDQKMTVEQLAENESEKFVVLKEKTDAANYAISNYESYKKIIYENIDAKQAEIKQLEESLLKMNLQLDADLLENESKVKIKEEEINQLKKHSSESIDNAKGIYRRLVNLANHLFQKVDSNAQFIEDSLSKACDNINDILVQISNMS